jgi:hypothetical protein
LAAAQAGVDQEPRLVCLKKGGVPPGAAPQNCEPCRHADTVGACGLRGNGAENKVVHKLDDRGELARFF